MKKSISKKSTLSRKVSSSSIQSRTKKGPKKASELLVAVDMSEGSRILLDQAVIFSEQSHFKIRIIYCLDWMRWHNAALKIKPSEIVRQNIEKVKSFYGLSNEMPVEISMDGPFEGISKAAKKASVAMVILGVHSGIKSAAQHFFLGSTAERLALVTKKPLFLLKGTKISHLQRVLVPSDWSARTLKAQKELVALGVSTEQMTFLHVRTPPPPILDYTGWQMAEVALEKVYDVEKGKFSKKNPQFKIQEVHAASVDGEVSRRAQEFDLVAIKPRKKSGLLSQIGSVTLRISKTCPTSLLILPE